jgi:hypothetical protein
MAAHLFQRPNGQYVQRVTFTSKSVSKGEMLKSNNLRGHILKSNNLVLDGRPNIEIIQSNMFGELMLHRV